MTLRFFFGRTSETAKFLWQISKKSLKKICNIGYKIYSIKQLN